MNRENEFFKIGNKKIAIGLSWSLIEAGTVSGRKKKAENTIKSTGLFYGLLLDNPEKNDALLALTSDENKGAYIGGQLLSEKIVDGAFFTQVSSEEDDSGKLFWLCAIGANGRVISEYDCIVEENELAQRISDLQSLSVDLKLYSPQEYFRVFPDYDVLSLELKELSKSKNLQSHTAVDLRKKTNYPLLTASIVALSITSYIGYEYIYKENPLLTDISSGVLYENEVQKELKVSSDNKKLKNKKNMNQKEYESLANIQLKEIFDRQFYSKEEIVENIGKMVDALPQYLVEYELKQISYNKNSFLFLYERIGESSGTFNQMKIHLDNILKDQNINHEWLGADDNLTQATFRINFDSEKESIYINKKSNEQSRLNDEKDPTKNHYEEIKKIKSKISDLVSSAAELSFVDKRWGDKPDKIHEAIISQASLINGEVNKIKSIYKKEKLLKTKMQDDNLMGEVHYDTYYNSFINKSQLHQSYAIGTPSQLGTLPSVTKEKTKKKKRKSNKDKAELTPVVNIYEFAISSKENSTGLDQVQEAMNIIDNKSIIYFNVDYNINTNDWIIRGNMYEANN